MANKRLDDPALGEPHRQEGRMTRRGFVQFALASGVTVVASQGMFAGRLSAQGKPGGSIRAALADGQSTDSLDPTTWGTNYFSSEFGSLSSDTLVALDQTNSVVPRIAEEFSATDGATKWTFKIRKGVKFKNGNELTPADVVASINAHRGEESKSGSKAALDQVADLAVDGDNVVFTLKAGNADFPVSMASYRLAMFPANADGGIDFNSGSCGAFHITEFEPGVRVKAVRNPDFWDAANVYFDDVELLVVADAAARTNALLTGEVQYIDRVDLKTVEMLKANPDVEIDNVTGFSHLVATMNTTVAPFDNADVRMAIKYAINREEILEKILFGYGTVGNDNPMAPVLKYATNPEPVHSYDPAKAKEHLAKAGFDSLTIDLSTSEAAFGGATDAAALIQASAAAAGITVNIINEPADSYWDAVWMKKPFMLSYWGGRATIDEHATQAYAAEAAWNDTFWKNPRFNELLVAARAETDEAKRGEMYAEMQQLLHDDGGQIVLAFNNYVTAHSKTVAHGELNSNLDHDGTYMWRRWWMA